MISCTFHIIITKRLFCSFLPFLHKNVTLIALFFKDKARLILNFKSVTASLIYNVNNQFIRNDYLNGINYGQCIIN